MLKVYTQVIWLIEIWKKEMRRPARRRDAGEGQYDGAVDQAAAPENRAGMEALREELAAIEFAENAFETARQETVGQAFEPVEHLRI